MKRFLKFYILLLVIAVFLQNNLAFSKKLYFLSPVSLFAKKPIVEQSHVLVLENLVQEIGSEISEELSLALGIAVPVYSYVGGSLRYVQLDNIEGKSFSKDLDVVFAMDIDGGAWRSLNYDYSLKKFTGASEGSRNNFSMGSVNDNAFKDLYKSKFQEKLKKYSQLQKNDFYSEVDLDVLLYKFDKKEDVNVEIVHEFLAKMDLIFRERGLNDDGTYGQLSSENDEMLWRYGSKFSKMFAKKDITDYVEYGKNFYFVKQVLQLKFYLDDRESYRETLWQFQDALKNNTLAQLAVDTRPDYQRLKKLLSDIRETKYKPNAEYAPYIQMIYQRLTGPIRMQGVDGSVDLLSNTSSWVTAAA